MKNQLLSCLILACAAPWASAAPIITNLPFGSPGVVSSSPAKVNNIAAGFGMPGGSNYTLDSVTMQMTVFAPFTSLSVSLYGGTASAPSGAALLNFNNPVIVTGSAPQPLTFTPGNAFTLNASTNYWIVLNGDGPSANDVNWNGRASSTTGIATFLGQTFDSNLPPTTPLTIFGCTGGCQLAFQVDATEQTQGNGVPEPGTITLLGAGIAALAFLRRR